MIYVEIGSSLASYDGLSEQDIIKMLQNQNLTFKIIDEQTYQQKFNALPQSNA